MIRLNQRVSGRIKKGLACGLVVTFNVNRKGEKSLFFWLVDPSRAVFDLSWDLIFRTKHGTMKCICNKQSIAFTCAVLILGIYFDALLLSKEKQFIFIGMGNKTAINKRRPSFFIYRTSIPDVFSGKYQVKRNILWLGFVPLITWPNSANHNCGHEFPDRKVSSRLFWLIAMQTILPGAWSAAVYK